MNRIKILLIVVCVFIISCANSQNDTLPYFNQMDHFSVDSVVYYQNPFFYEFEAAQEEYIPRWFIAYEAGSYPLAFDNYIEESIKYFHHSIDAANDDLKEYERIWQTMSKEEIVGRPYSYVFGEVWITLKRTNEHCLLVLEQPFLEPQIYPDYGTFDFTKPNIDESDECYPFFSEPLSMNTYVVENDTIKMAAPYYVIEGGIREYGKYDFIWPELKVFNDFLGKLETYTRSRIVNGERIFEKVINTPNGPVLESELNNKGWKWWLIGGLLFIVAVVLVIIRKR